MKIKTKAKRQDNSQQVFVLSGCIMSDIVFGGRSDIWSTNLGCASVGTPDIRPPPQTISYTYLTNFSFEFFYAVFTDASPLFVYLGENR